MVWHRFTKCEEWEQTESVAELLNRSRKTTGHQQDDSEVNVSLSDMTSVVKSEPSEVRSCFPFVIIIIIHSRIAYQEYFSRLYLYIQDPSGIEAWQVNFIILYS